MKTLSKIAVLHLSIGSFLVFISAVTGAAATKLDAQMVPMLKITGDIGSTNQIQYLTDLSQSNHWIPLTNIVLSTSPVFFVDTTATGIVKRFYQTVVLSGPFTNISSNPTTNFVWIQPGAFVMGSPDNEKDRYSWEGLQTQVTISHGFWMSAHEVTQKEYLAVMDKNPSYFAGDLNLPVEQVSWRDATNYCGKLTQQERLKGRLPEGYVYRLPTEAEWEYACRAGTTTRFSYGDDLKHASLGKYAWFLDNSESTTHPVGQKEPNGWGLYDMHGNLWEWCLDWWDYSLPGGNLTDPKGPSSGNSCVYRGGCWYCFGWDCRSASRDYYSPDYVGRNIGFRPVLAPAL